MGPPQVLLSSSAKQHENSIDFSSTHPPHRAWCKRFASIILAGPTLSEVGIVILIL